ncbi:hypothetical protein [Thiocystis violacea]|uniref:hypothetical protein n=1 Tax=Thiocystis violacea TaxID=13725 RepID=UPI0019050113|nr:hypothetical protein [Thiocystis violacea]
MAEFMGFLVGLPGLLVKEMGGKRPIRAHAAVRKSAHPISRHGVSVGSTGKTGVVILEP